MEKIRGRVAPPLPPLPFPPGSVARARRPVPQQADRPTVTIRSQPTGRLSTLVHCRTMGPILRGCDMARLWSACGARSQAFPGNARSRPGNGTEIGVATPLQKPAVLDPTWHSLSLAHLAQCQPIGRPSSGPGDGKATPKAQRGMVFAVTHRC